MLRILSPSRFGFSDPWKPQRKLYFQTPRLDPNLFSETEKQKVRKRAMEAKQKGGYAYFKEGVDQTVDPEHQKEKQDLIDELKNFQSATGLDQTKNIKKVEDCLQPSDLDGVKEKLRNQGLRYLNNPKDKNGLLQKSMAYVPMHPAEKSLAKAKEDHFVEWLETLPTFAPKGTDSLASAIAHFDKFIEPRLKFRNKLKKQTKLVQDSFFLKLGKVIDPTQSEKDILESVLETVKKVESYPQAVQSEYRKAVEEGKDPDKAHLEIIKEFEEKVALYESLMPEDRFGGKMIETPKGKMRAARWEFIKWIQSTPNDFAHMNRLTELLISSELPKRNKTYQRRDELLDQLPKDQAEQLREKTNEMRLHNLTAYVKDLESLVGKTSIHVLEYMALLEAAEYEGIPLFTDEEKAHMKNEILTDKPEVQKLELDLLKEKGLQKREELAKEFENLPIHLTLGYKNRFKKMSADQRRNFLRKRRDILQNESANPFDLAKEDGLDANSKKRINLHALKSQTGRDLIRERMQKDRAAQSYRVVTETTTRIADWIKKLETENLTQMTGRMKEDGHHGLHGYNDDAYKAGFDPSLAKTEQDQIYGNTFVNDWKLRNAGMDRKSGGKVVDELQIVDHHSWMEGDDSVLEALDASPYDNMVMFTGTDGKDELHMREQGKLAYLNNKNKLLQALIQFLGLQGASQEIMDELEEVALDMDEDSSYSEEFYGVQSANHNKHFALDEEELAA